jgi:uncharacterized protein (TIGR01244 family)
MTNLLRGVGLAVVCGAVAVSAQKETIGGIRNFTKVDATVACAGSTETSAMAELAKRGYKTVVSLRESSEAGALIDESQAAASAAGLRFVHLPFNSSRPDEGQMDRFIALIKDPSSQPLLLYCASGSRAGAMWLAKRMLVDGWPEDRASAEAVMIGLSSPTLKQFALDYVAKRK